VDSIDDNKLITLSKIWKCPVLQEAHPIENSRKEHYLICYSTYNKVRIFVRVEVKEMINAWTLRTWKRG